MTETHEDPEAGLLHAVVQGNDLMLHMEGCSRFDAGYELIEDFHTRVSGALVAPYFLDRDRNLIVYSKNRQNPRDICAPILVNNLILSSNENSASLRIEMLSDDGEIEICEIPNDDLASATPKGVLMLRARGLYMPGNAKDIAALLRSFRPTILRSADLPAGWHPAEKPIFGLRDGHAVTSIRSPLPVDACPYPLFLPDQEKLQRWKSEIASHADGNPYVLFGIGLALAGPVVSLMNKPAIGFNLAMPTSNGKTTIAQIMQNMWPNLPIEGWKHSDAALEDNCIASSGSLLLLDEMPKAQDREVIEAVYFIMNGRPRSVRQTLGEQATSTRRPNWSMAVFSTSEDPFEQMVKRSKRTSDGAMVRLIDLKPDIIWKELHGKKSTYDMIKHMNAALPATSGIAGPFFVARLLDSIDKHKDFLPKILESTLYELERFLNINRADATGIQMRVLEAFAMVAAAAQVAAQLKVLPQTPPTVRLHLFEVAQNLFHPKTDTENSPDRQHQEAIERLRCWLAQNAESKLIALDARGGATANNRMAYGWRKGETYFLLKPTLRQATGMKQSMTPLLDYMARRGILMLGGQPSSYQRRMGAGVHGRPWVYAIDRAALEEDANPPETEI